MKALRTLRTKRTAPAPIDHPSHKTYYKKVLSGEIDIGLKCELKLADGTEIRSPVRLKSTVKPVRK